MAACLIRSTANKAVFKLHLREMKGLQNASRFGNNFGPNTIPR
jgi:hypothetical protein